jgi:C1A family cysteine protease
MKVKQRALPVILFLVGLPTSAAGYTFDWRDVDGLDFTTPVRQQGMGDCWAFAACAAFEAKLEITADDPDWNPDTSEMHLILDGVAGGRWGGGATPALWRIESMGIVDESECPYIVPEPYPEEYWPLEDGW